MNTEISVLLPDDLIKEIGSLSKKSGKSPDEVIICLLELALSHEYGQPTLKANESPEQENGGL
jgi:hypothetical protein